MTTRIGRYGLALCCVTVLASGFAWGQQKSDDKDKAKGAPADSMAEKMAHWAEYMQEFGSPGPEHETLKRMVGTWDVATSYFMAEGMPPDKSTGTCEYRSILDGRIIVQDYQAASEASGFSMTGFGLIGFDRFKGKHFAVWTDTMSTGVSVWEGSANASGNKVVYWHEDINPMTREPKKAKMVTEQVSDDEMTMKMFEIRKDGSERLELEITYTRQRKAAAGA